MAAAITDSVMQGMQQQPSNHSLSHYNSFKRRQSISARKRREEAIVKKSVMMNASQHQQLLNLVKQQKHATSVKDDTNTANISIANNTTVQPPLGVTSSPELNALSTPAIPNMKQDLEHQSYVLYCYILSARIPFIIRTLYQIRCILCAFLFPLRNAKSTRTKTN